MATKWLIDFFAVIPPIVWSGAIGAFTGALITLFGVWRQNLAHDRRQQSQLEHDAEQRHLDRQRSLQREIYLGAVEAIAKWQKFMISFADTALPTAERNQIIEGANEQIGKAYIIGNIETLSALDKLNEYFSEKSFQLLEKHFEVTLVSGRASLVETELQAAREVGNQFTSAAQTAQQNGDYSLATAFLNLFQTQRKKIEEIDVSLTKITKERDALIVDLAIAASKVANEFAVRSLDTIFSIRREIGLDISQDLEITLRESVNTTANKVYENMRQWAEKLQQRLNEEFYQKPE